uniref:GED domain-containing protein n=1 Tax=Macrostomum lignano TaxID=282301 RepID=A0A1I8F493_9PLAT
TESTEARAARKEISYAIRNIHGIRTGLFTPDMAFETIVKQQIARMKEPTLKCVDMVVEEPDQRGSPLHRENVQLPEASRATESIVTTGSVNKKARPSPQLMLLRPADSDSSRARKDLVSQTGLKIRDGESRLFGKKNIFVLFHLRGRNTYKDYKYIELAAETADEVDSWKASLCWGRVYPQKDIRGAGELETEVSSSTDPQMERQVETIRNLVESYMKIVDKDSARRGAQRPPQLKDFLKTSMLAQLYGTQDQATLMEESEGESVRREETLRIYKATKEAHADPQRCLSQHDAHADAAAREDDWIQPDSHNGPGGAAPSAACRLPAGETPGASAARRSGGRQNAAEPSMPSRPRPGPPPPGGGGRMMGAHRARPPPHQQAGGAALPPPMVPHHGLNGIQLLLFLKGARCCCSRSERYASSAPSRSARLLGSAGPPPPAPCCSALPWLYGLCGGRPRPVRDKQLPAPDFRRPVRCTLQPRPPPPAYQATLACFFVPPPSALLLLTWRRLPAGRAPAKARVDPRYPSCGAAAAAATSPPLPPPAGVRHPRLWWSRFQPAAPAADVYLCAVMLDPESAPATCSASPSPAYAGYPALPGQRIAFVVHSRTAARAERQAGCLLRDWRTGRTAAHAAARRSRSPNESTPLMRPRSALVQQTTAVLWRNALSQSMRNQKLLLAAEASLTINQSIFEHNNAIPRELFVGARRARDPTIAQHNAVAPAVGATNGANEGVSGQQMFFISLAAFLAGVSRSQSSRVPSPLDSGWRRVSSAILRTVVHLRATLACTTPHPTAQASHARFRVGRRSPPAVVGGLHAPDEEEAVALPKRVSSDWHRDLQSRRSLGGARLRPAILPCGCPWNLIAWAVIRMEKPQFQLLRLRWRRAAAAAGSGWSKLTRGLNKLDADCWERRRLIAPCCSCRCRLLRAAAGQPPVRVSLGDRLLIGSWACPASGFLIGRQSRCRVATRESVRPWLLSAAWWPAA